MKLSPVHRRRTTRALLSLACIAAAATWAPQVSAAEGPLQSQMCRMWIVNRAHFALSGGRIVNNHGNGWVFPMGSRSMSDGDIRESLNFTGNGASGAVTYSFQRVKTGADNRKEVELDYGLEFSSDGRFVLRCRDKDDPQGCFEFTQEPARPVRLSLPPADKPRVLEAPTVWHLLMVHRDECRKGLLPRLEALRSDWRIDATLTAAEEELVKLAAGAEKPDRQQWAAWVTELGDPLCTRRERAERKLREAGPAVLAFLNRLNTAPLDTEQQIRVRRVIHALSVQQGEDTPENIAALLIGDPQVWLALLSHKDVAVRRAAVKQLELALNAPVKVDPKADPASQAKAREEVSRQVEKLAAKP